MKLGDYDIQIVKAKYEEKGILRNLINLYEYDVSEFSGNEPNSYGIYEYLYLDHYWTPEGIEKEGRIPYLIKVNGSLAGFALLNNYSCLDRTDIDYSIVEFFVMRKWRKRGIGKATATHLWRMHPGKWEIAQERENVNAKNFWRSVITDYTNGVYEEHETDEKIVQVFG